MNVLIVDDNAIVRLGLARIVEQIPDVERVDEASDGVEALEAVMNFSPDVVLLDIRMPRMTGLEVLAQLPKNINAIMLTSKNDADTISEAIGLGAKGYLVHGSFDTAQVIGAIETCKKGGIVLGPEAAVSVNINPTSLQPDKNSLAELLTEREMQVLESAAKGLSNKEIAEIQYLSPRTVKNYLNSAYVKLGVHNRAEAVLMWHRASAPN